MAVLVISNTSPSKRVIFGYVIPAGGEADIPGDVVKKYKALGPGTRQLFTSGVFKEKAKPKPRQPKAADDAELEKMLAADKDKGSE